MKFSDRTFPLRHRIHAFRFALLVGLVASLIPAPAWSAYVQTNLVSDIPGVAQVTDPNLVNPWGISHNSTGPFWVSDNGTGRQHALQRKRPDVHSTDVPLVVTIPPPSGGAPPSAPTGQVFNGGSSFDLRLTTGTFHLRYRRRHHCRMEWRYQRQSSRSTTLRARSIRGLRSVAAVRQTASTPPTSALDSIDVFDGAFAPVSLGGDIYRSKPPFGICSVQHSEYRRQLVRDVRETGPDWRTMRRALGTVSSMSST